MNRKIREFYLEKNKVDYAREITIKKKILFLVQLPPPVHGVSVTNKKIIESKLLLNSDIEFTVIPFMFSNSIEDIDKLNVKKVVKTLSIAFKLMYQCLLNRPNLVYFTLSVMGNTFYRDVLYVAILKLFRINIVYHLHRVGVREAGLKSRIRHRLYKWVFADAWVIHLTPILYDDISAYVKNDRCIIVMNGIDDPVQPELSKNINVDGPIRFSFLSHMLVEKGVIVMLNALVELKNRELEFEATFAGSGITDECKRAFDELVPQNKMEKNIRCIGAVYGADKNNFFMNKDILVFPTLYDCSPIVILEAMAYSLPIVATIQGGIPDLVIDPETAYLVEKNDYLSLANKMEELANNEELRRKMGVNGRKRFENGFTTDKFESNMIDALRECLVVKKAH